MNISCYAGDMYGLPIMFLNDYIRNVTSNVTHVMEFTEECLTVFGHALLCVYFWLLGSWAEMIRSRSSYRQTYAFPK